MSNPYEPPGAPDLVSSPRERKHDRTLLLRFLLAVSVISALLFVASLPPFWDPAIILTGPVWLLRHTSHVVAGGAITAFCALGFGALIVRPRWYTGLFAWVALAAWVGTSFYMLLLTSPE